MKTKYILIFFIVFGFSSQEAFSQNRDRRMNSNVGSLFFSAGASHSLGDFRPSISSNPHLAMVDINNVRYELSLGYRHSFPNRFGYRLSIHHGLYESTDANPGRLPNATSNITMLTALGEFNILQFPNTNRPWRVYVYGGGGLAYASINFGGNLISTMDNATFRTSELAPIIPFGLGFDVWVSSNFNIGLEGGFKYAFSDYMNGVRLAGSRNDMLANVSLTVSYKLFGGGSSRRRSCCRW